MLHRAARSSARPAIMLFLVPALLMIEGVYYFGLGDAVVGIHPLLRWSPMALLACSLLALAHTFVQPRHRRSLRAWVLINAALIVGLAYWGVLWP